MFIGVHRDGPLSNNDIIIQKTFANLDSLGARSLRINIWWKEIEISEGNYFWNTLDKWVNEANKRNISIMLTVRGYSEFSLYSEEQKISAYKEYLTNLFNRYKNKIYYYQIENELTDKRGWHENLLTYQHILKIAKETLQSIEPDGKIVLAGIASAQTEIICNDSLSLRGIKLKDQFDRLINLTINYFDIIDLHLYHDVNSIPQRVKFVRNYISELTNGKKDIWASEIGGPDQRTTSANKYTNKDFQVELINRFLNIFSVGVKRAFWQGLSISSKQEGNFTYIPLMMEWNARPQYSAFIFVQSLIKNILSVRVEFDQEGLSNYTLMGKNSSLELIVTNNDYKSMLTQISSLNIMTTGNKLIDIYNGEVYKIEAK